VGTTAVHPVEMVPVCGRGSVGRARSSRPRARAEVVGQLLDGRLGTVDAGSCLRGIHLDVAEQLDRRGAGGLRWFGDGGHGQATSRPWRGGLPFAFCSRLVRTVELDPVDHRGEVWSDGSTYRGPVAVRLT